MSVHILQLLKKISKAIESVYTQLMENQIVAFLEWVVAHIHMHFKNTSPDISLFEGEIFLVDLGFTVGKELMKSRPCVVVSRSFSNQGDLVYVAPITGARDKMGQIKKKSSKYFVYVAKTLSNNLHKDGYVVLGQVRAVSKLRIGKKIGRVDKVLLKKIRRKLGKILGI